MSEHARDTQFMGFAELLAQELRGWEMSTPDVKQIIARRAYDLVRHALDCTGAGFYASHYLAEGEDIADVDDLTAWPEATRE